jgi:magnesium transporter
VVDVWEVREGGLHQSVASAADAAAIAASSSGTTWLHASPEEIHLLGPALDLHPHIVEDVLLHTQQGSTTAQRTKLQRFDNVHLLYLYRAVVQTDGTSLLVDTPVIVSPHCMITLQTTNGIEPEEIVRRLQGQTRLLGEGVSALQWALLDLVVDSHLDAVDSISDAVDTMEDDLFSVPTTSMTDPREAQMHSFATRKSLVELRRAAQPMREVVSGLMRRTDGKEAEVSATMQPYYQDVYDHVLRIAEGIEGLRDLITTIYETRLALNDHSLNSVMRQLAAWAAIIAVPTAVTGFYGQNVPYPGFAHVSGYWTSTAIWVGVSILLYFSFRKRHWL